MSLAFDTIRPRPILDVAEELEAQSTDELLRRLVNLFDMCVRSAPDDHVSLSITRLRGEVLVRVVSGPEKCDPEVVLRGIGPSLQAALVELLRSQLTDDEDDDRPTYVSELAPEDVAQA